MSTKDNRDGFTHDPSDAPTEIYPPVDPPRSGDFADDHYGYSEDYPETTEFTPVDGYTTQQGYDRNGDYNFEFDKEFEQNKALYDYINVPSRFKDGDYINRSKYEELYDVMVETGEWSKDIQERLVYRLNVSGQDIQELSTQVENLETRLHNEKSQTFAKDNSIQERTEKLDREEKALESEKARHKALLYGSIIAAVLCAIIAIVALLMWSSAKSDSASESQRSSVHQEKITELEKALKESQSESSGLSGQNKELQEKLNSADQRAKDAEKAVEDVRKDSVSKDEQIGKLEEEVKQLRDNPVTSTSTVTRTSVSTASPSPEDSVTVTVTETAEPEPSE